MKIEDCIWRDGHYWQINKDNLTEFLNENAENYNSLHDLCKNNKKICKSTTLYDKLHKSYINSFDWGGRVYQKESWLYEHFMVKGMSRQEIADLAGISKRSAKRWLAEKNRFSCRYRSENQKINNIQKSLMMAGKLGDGCISLRHSFPTYTESHAENQKDYLYWKYGLLKNLCVSPPSKEKPHGEGMQYSYRFRTRSLKSLEGILAMDIIELLESLDEFMLSTYLLDDAYRGKSGWSLSVVRFSDKQKNKAVDIFNNKFNLNAKATNYDNIYFTAESSRKIDEMILSHIPNELDIIKYKIINNDKIKKEFIHRILDNGVGLSTFCKKNKLRYDDSVKTYFDNTSRNQDDIAKYIRGVVNE